MKRFYDEVRPVRLMLSLFLTMLCLVTAKNAVAQNKGELCQNNKARLAELEHQNKQLSNDLFQSNDFASHGQLGRDRTQLAEYKDALRNPRRTSDLMSDIEQQGGRKQWAERSGIEWKQEYSRNDRLFIQALYNAKAKYIDRLMYVQAHRAEIEQQQAEIQRQIAYHRNRLIELRCDEPSSSSSELSVVGTWTWAYAEKGDPEKHGTVTFNADPTDSNKGTMDWSGNSHGTWSQSGLTVELHWDKKITDTMTLIEGGKKLKGTNSKGWTVIGTRP